MIRCPAFSKVINISFGPRQLFSTSLCITVDVSNLILIFFFQLVLGTSNKVLDLFMPNYARLFEVIADLSPVLISFYSEASPLSISSIGDKSSYYLARVVLIFPSLSDYIFESGLSRARFISYTDSFALNLVGRSSNYPISSSSSKEP